MEAYWTVVLETFCVEYFEVSCGLWNISDIQAENYLFNLCNGFYIL